MFVKNGQGQSLGVVKVAEVEAPKEIKPTEVESKEKAK